MTITSFSPKLFSRPPPVAIEASSSVPEDGALEALLFFQGLGVPVRNVREMENIQELRLRCKDIKDDDCKHFKYLKEIKKLDVAGNIISAAGAEHLSSLTTLVELDISENYIGTLDWRGTRPRADGTEHLNKLTNLVTLKADDADYIIEALSLNENLSELYINSYSNISKEKMQKIKELLLKNRQIKIAPSSSLQPNSSTTVPSASSAPSPAPLAIKPAPRREKKPGILDRISNLFQWNQPVPASSNYTASREQID